jgi:hypothetical protein
VQYVLVVVVVAMLKLLQVRMAVIAILSMLLQLKVVVAPQVRQVEHMSATVEALAAPVH